ncbi:unnamed protein product [Parnassius mnemosyne]|uniref:Ty3 transposon capsid-like protein domain-containing protein n=1 Tax=Parnassius mnemosyne TaxID=213953 RepID=A0AAV1LT23_9NEOP
MAFPNGEAANFKMIAELIPRYDGNTKRLNHYIREIENILNLLDDTARVHPAIICLIKSRLSGTAIDAIAYQETLNSWETIKDALVRRLREPRNEIQVMQELSRVRRNRNEDAETLGKRLREILDTLFSVGTHTNKSYYENMVIEQYTSNLDFQVSIAVRITQPTTLESAIVIARQEEAKLSFNKTFNNNNYSAPSTSAQAKFREPIRAINRPQNSLPLRFGNSGPMQNQTSNKAPVLRQNNLTPEQRQQWVQSMLPWKNRPSSGNFRASSGNFRNNIPQLQAPAQKVSDVTMRSVSKPQKPQFAAEELFYTGPPGQRYEQQYGEDDTDYVHQQGQYAYCSDNYNQQVYESPMDDGEVQQDFYQGPVPSDQS